MGHRIETFVTKACEKAITILNTLQLPLTPSQRATHPVNRDALQTFLEHQTPSLIFILDSSKRYRISAAVTRLTNQLELLDRVNSGSEEQLRQGLEWGGLKHLGLQILQVAESMIDGKTETDSKTEIDADDVFRIAVLTGAPLPQSLIHWALQDADLALSTGDGSTVASKLQRNAEHKEKLVASLICIIASRETGQLNDYDTDSQLIKIAFNALRLRWWNGGDKAARSYFARLTLAAAAIVGVQFSVTQVKSLTSACNDDGIGGSGYHGIF